MMRMTGAAEADASGRGARRMASRVSWAITLVSVALLRFDGPRNRSRIIAKAHGGRGRNAIWGILAEETEATDADHDA